MWNSSVPIATPATQVGTPRRRTPRSVRKVPGVDYAVSALSNADGNCPILCVKDVDGHIEIIKPMRLTMQKRPRALLFQADMPEVVQGYTS
jgi:hypothetical protein